MADMEISSANIAASRVSGTEVYNRAGEHLGSIHDVVIGKRDGKVKYAIMSFGGFLGIGEEYHPLPWSALDYETNAGGYVVDLDQKKLEGAPHYGSRNEPNWSDEAYGRQVDTYYGFLR